MKNRYGVKVTDEWAKDFANRNKMSVKEAKFLLKITVGWDNLIYALTSVFKKRSKKPTLEEILRKVDGDNPHEEQISDTQGKELL